MKQKTPIKKKNTSGDFSLHEINSYDIFQKFPEALLITTKKGIICYVNPAWEKLTGYTLQEVQGKTPHTLYEDLWQKLKNGKSYITEDIIDRKKDGTEYQIHSTFSTISIKNSQEFYLQVIHDNTDSQQARRELRESEEKLRTIIDNAKGYAIYMLDKFGFIKTWNQGALEMSGYTKDEVLGKNISLFYTKEDIKNKKPEVALKIANEKGKFEDEMERVRKDGTHYYARISISSIKNEKEELQGFSQITHDITLQKKLETQRDEFINIASHELKTPITSMAMYAEILEHRINQEGKNNLEIISRMRRQTNKLISMVDDLVNTDRIMNKNWPIHKRDFDLDLLTQNVINQIQKTTSTHKITKLGHINKNVFADKESIIEVLKSLITNAIKYSPNKDKVIISLSATAKNAQVAVKDFGMGIAKEDTRDLFQKFHRSKHKQLWQVGGLGLGLYIASEIIKIHQGKMWVKSEEGKGSTFSFSLPLTK